MVSNTMTRTNAPGQGPARRPRQATTKLKKFPPVSPTVTDYDHAHHATYLRLLDADNEGADWQEVARVVLELDPIADPETVRAGCQSKVTDNLLIRKANIDPIWIYLAKSGYLSRFRSQI
jgi:hypothetical protein